MTKTIACVSILLVSLVGCAVPVTDDEAPAGTTDEPLVACPHAPTPTPSMARTVWVPVPETVCVLSDAEVTCPPPAGVIMWKSVVVGAGVPAVCDAQGWRDGVSCPRGTACTVLTTEGVRSGVCAER